jgi:regulatory protein
MQQKQITYEKALSKAMYLCSKTEKCKADIRKKLYDWKANPSEHDKIISELEKQQFIDEERFANFYVRDKFKFNNWGKTKIKAMLFQKQIPEKLVHEAINQISDTEYINTLKKLLTNKEKQIKETDTYKKKNKLLQFATSRGFEPNLILQIIDN